MKFKIIYLGYAPLIKKRENDFYMDELIKAGVSIEYWDLTNIFFPNINFGLEIERAYIKKINDYKELKEMILAQEMRKSLFVLMIYLNGMVIKLHRILKKCGCHLVYFARTGIPVFSKERSILKKFFFNYHNYLTLYGIKEKCFYELARILQKLGLIKHYDIVFAAGSVEASSYAGKSRVIHINHFDYDQYLGLKDNQDRIIAGEYCVFLDDNLVCDTDYQINNIEPIEPVAYFKSLGHLFDRLEKKYDLKVIIAAHPKSEYRGDEFGSRQLIKDKTNELVKDCQFAIAHYSTSVAFAVLYKKPVIFIYTEEMRTKYYIDIIINFANELSAGTYNIDRDGVIDVIEIKSPDLQKYHDYKYRYLTSKTSDSKLSKDIFMEYLCIA